MDDVLDTLTRRAWPTIEDQWHTTALAITVVLAMVGCATVAAGAATETAVALLGGAAVVFVSATIRIWDLPKRRADFDSRTFEFTSPFELSDSGGTSVDFQDVRRVELRAHTVSRPRRHTRRFAYFILRMYTEHRSEPYRLESGDFDELHRLLDLGRALGGELDVRFDVGIDRVEPGHVRRGYQSSWWSAPAVRVGMFSLIVVASLVGLTVAGLEGGVPPLGFLVLALAAVALGAGAFYAWGRYHYPDQMGRHTLSVEESDTIEISSINPFRETYRYRAADLDVIAIHDGHDPAILFVEDERTRLLALRDRQLARDLAADLPRAFETGDRDHGEAPTGDRPPETSHR